MASSPSQQIVETQQLGSSPALLYDSPAGTWTQILALTATNTDTTSHTLTLYIVPAGSIATNATMTTPGRGILAGGNYHGQNETGQILNPGDALWGQADTGGVVNILASGLLTVS